MSGSLNINTRARIYICRYGLTVASRLKKRYKYIPAVVINSQGIQATIEKDTTVAIVDDTTFQESCAHSPYDNQLTSVTQ